MTSTLDGVLTQWGERLFYPGNRRVGSRTPELRIPSLSMRSRIEATVRRAPQVMVKVTGGGRGMAAIAAHFRYISKNGRLEIEDDRGVVEQGRETLRELELQWRFGGAYIADESPRREAFNVMLSMPRGTDPLTVLKAAREFARIEFADHRYVMVLHDHQANPHVHLSVKARSKHGKRLNPRKPDLHRWRETFAERLREWGVDCEATRQASRGEHRNQKALWRVKAAEDGRQRVTRPGLKAGPAMTASRNESLRSWKRIAEALVVSNRQEDHRLAEQVVAFVKDMPMLGATSDRKRKEQSQTQRAGATSKQHEIGTSGERAALDRLSDR